MGLSATMLAAGALAQPDGSFEMRGLIGTRIVRVHGLPSGWTLKGVRAAGIDVTDAEIQIVDDVSGVEIVVTARPTQVIGSVTDARGAAVVDAAAIIFPEDRQRRTAPFNRFVTSARTEVDGTFKIAALPPGNYLAVAVETLVDGEWAEAENLERLAARATRFSLSEGESRGLTLRIPHP